MLIARRTLIATAVLLAFAAASARATIPIHYGTTELGKIVSVCFTACFGSNCSAAGTVDSITVAAPFFVRGLRIADSDSPSPCNPGSSLTPANLTLPQSVSAGRVLVFDVDLLPKGAGPVARTLSLNGQEHFTLDALVNPVFDCFPSGQTLCLSDDRFQVRYHWRAFDGARGAGTTVPGSSADSGLFYFFDQDNWEALVKVLDGCGINQRYWSFAAATTNVEYTLTVTDTESQVVKAYFNPMGAPAPAITDTDAFATCP
jgi:hypothetical protein